MTPQALTALQKSIAHWERLATGNRKPDELVGGSWCALCDEFNGSIPFDERCQGCPVYEKTGKRFCAGTPWVAIERVIDHHYDEQATAEWLDNTEEARELAAKELAFLKSLLPVEEK